MSPNVQKCPNASEEQKPGFIPCEGCGKFFEKEQKRGRPPKSCSWYRSQSEKLNQKAREERKEAVKEGFTAVPVLEVFEDVDQVEVGDVVFAESSLFSKDISKRMFAKEYKVLHVDRGQDLIEVIRNTKTGYKHQPTVVPLGRIKRKVGVEYIEFQMDTYEGITDDE